MIALLGRLAYQLIENQFAMLLECAQALFKRKEQRLRQLWGLARIKRVLNNYTLASDLDRQFGDVPVGLGKMAANHRSKDTGIPDCEKSKPRLGRCTSAKRSYGAGRPVCVVEVGARACPLRQYFGGASVSTARAACPLSASAAVTAVTSYSSNSPLFFGRPICALRSPFSRVILYRPARVGM